MLYNVIVVEDDQAHGATLENMLGAVYHHQVRWFRDQCEFEAAVRRASDGTDALFSGQNEDRPLVVILDIMLAEEFDHALRGAPRWRAESEPTEDERRRHVDDRLGLEIARKLRNGHYETALPATAPLLFFTARRNQEVMEEALAPRMHPARYLTKPAFTATVEKAIQELATLDRGAKTQQDIQP